MSETALNQAYIFSIFILVGLLIGILFDIFRILRRSFKTPDFLTYLEDISFWIITGILVLFTIFKFNNGEIRAYLFMGIIIGIVLYILLFSKTFISINVAIIKWIKNIFNLIIKILIYPFTTVFKILKKIFLKPISFIFINFRKKTTDITKKLSKIHIKSKNKHKNEELKKDFI